jgi:hypothetical protein
MTRPQLMIWYNQTSEREYQEKLLEEKSDWSKTANILAMIHNTQMGIKKRDMKDAKEFMPDFEEEADNEKLIALAREKGLNVPNK